MYKPVAGERPLWDFPDGTLAEREVAAYEVSAATGWDIVPPTVYRDGRSAPAWCSSGSPTDDDCRHRRLHAPRATSSALRRIAVFDAVINNADRKGGHLLPTTGGHVYGVDHGVSFHVEDKLRTVLWQWAGKPSAGRPRCDACGLRAELDGRPRRAARRPAHRREVRRTRPRVDRLLAAGRHPEPCGDWPPCPWPPI